MGVCLRNSWLAKHRGGSGGDGDGRRWRSKESARVDGARAGGPSDCGAITPRTLNRCIALRGTAGGDGGGIAG